MSEEKTKEELEAERRALELRRQAQAKHPSERFILCLITQGDPDRCTNEFIVVQLDRYRLPDAFSPYLDKLREKAKKGLPDPFFPSNKFHKPSMDYLRGLQIRDLHHPTREVEEANSILHDFAVRRDVEMGLLGRVPHNVIARQMRRRHGVSLTAAGVAAYEHYYWNVNAISLEEWSRVLDKLSLPYIVRERQLASLQGGRAVAMHKMGVESAIESQTMLKDIQRRLYFNFVETDERMPMCKEKSQMLASVGRAVLEYDKRITTSEHELKKLLKEFERLRLETDDTKPLPIGQLVNTGAGGSFSDTSDALSIGEHEDDETIH